MASSSTLIPFEWIELAKEAKTIFRPVFHCWSGQILGDRTPRIRSYPWNPTRTQSFQQELAWGDKEVDQR
jgi:hypothetical protein